MFREADSNPDKEVCYHELVNWVAHCSEVIDLFKRYEPEGKIQEKVKLFQNMNPSPEESPKKPRH